MSTVSTVSTGLTVSTVSTVIARRYLHLRWYFLSTKYMTPQSNVFLSCNQWQAMNVFLHYAKSRNTGDRLDSPAVSIFVDKLVELRWLVWRGACAEEA